MKRHFFHNFLTFERIKRRAGRRGWPLALTCALTCVLLSVVQTGLAAEGAPASKEYFHHQQAQTALLITLEAFEAEFESRIYGPDDALLSVAGVPQLRLGPVFQFLDATDKDRQIRIAVQMGHRSSRSTIDMRVSRFDPSGPDSSLQIKAYRLLAYGLEMNNLSRRDAWSLKVGSLKQAAALFEHLGMQELQLWSEFYAGHFLLTVLGDPISAGESAAIIQKYAALSGLKVLSLAALQLEGSALVAQARGRLANGDTEGSARQFAQAQQVFRQSADLAATIDMAYQQALAVYNSGLAFETTGQTNEAFSQFSAALDIATRGGDNDLGNQIRKRSAELMESQGKTSEAIAMMEEISASSPAATSQSEETSAADGEEESSGDSRADREMAHYLFEQGRLLEKTFRHDEAIEVLQQALQLDRRAPSVALTGPVSLLLAKALYEDGQPDLALQYLSDAIDRTPASRYRSRLEDSFGILASIQRYRGDYSAMKAARDRQEQFVNSEEAHTRILLEKGLDALASDGSNSDDARRLFRESIAAARQSGMTEVEQLAVLNLCAIGASLPGSAGACSESQAQQALRSLEASGLAKAMMDARWLWSRFLARNGQAGQSRTELNQLIDDMQFFAIRLPGVLGAWYWQNQEPIYGLSMSMVLPAGSPGGAVGNDASNRAALDQLARLSGFGNKLDAGRDGINTAQQNQDLNNLRSLFAARAEAENGAQAQRLAGETTRLLKQSMAEFAGQGNHRQAIGPALARLSNDDVFLTYYITDESAYAWLASRSGVQLYRLPWSDNQSAGLSRVVEGLRWDAAKGNIDDLPGMMDALGRSLLSPFAGQLKTTIYFLPSGRMEGLPLDALRWQGRYLAEQHKVVNVLSGQGVGANDLTISQDTTQNVFLAGNQLDGAGAFDVYTPPPQELRSVAGFFIGPGLHMIQGSALQWDEFQDPRFNQAGLVHLAMPGIIDLRNPARSRFLLSDNIAENEHITLSPQDVVQMNLSADLVVISNSNFVGSSITAFDLNTRFVAEFLQAGAGSVITSLWPVGDTSASRFMTTFYQSIQEGLPVGDALYQTKRKFIGPESQLQAGAWASFQLYLN